MPACMYLWSPRSVFSKELGLEKCSVVPSSEYGKAVLMKIKPTDKLLKNLQFRFLSTPHSQSIYYMCIRTYLIYKFFQNNGLFISHFKFLKGSISAALGSKVPFFLFYRPLMVWPNLLLSTHASFSASLLSADDQATSVNLLLLIQAKALILQTTSCYSWNYDNLVLATNQWTFKMQLKQQNSLPAKPW